MEEVKDMIYRQAAINAADMADYTGLAVEDVKKVTDEVIKELKKLSSAQPEHKTGKWEIYVISMLDGEGCRCSECGFEGTPYWNYCPNCGSYNGGEQKWKK